jgi:hypothetical protein
VTIEYHGLHGGRAADRDVASRVTLPLQFSCTTSASRANRSTMDLPCGVVKSTVTDLLLRWAHK